MHTIKATAANVHDVTMTSELLTGKENEVYGDSGYMGADKREDAKIRNKRDKKIKYKINRKSSQIRKLSVRVKVEHVFAVVKRQLGFRRTRYRGLAKQTAKFNIMFALANLILADRSCLTV